MKIDTSHPGRYVSPSVKFLEILGRAALLAGSGANPDGNESMSEEDIEDGGFIQL